MCSPGFASGSSQRTVSKIPSKPRRAFRLSTNQINVKIQNENDKMLNKNFKNWGSLLILLQFLTAFVIQSNALENGYLENKTIGENVPVVEVFESFRSDAMGKRKLSKKNTRNDFSSIIFFKIKFRYLK